MKLLITILAVLLITSSAFSETTYTWTGAVNSSLSTAGNWSPNRQVGLTSDILIFSTGTSINVTNVSQVTVGQLIIKNSTNLTLNPATGNDKTIFINGCAGDDFIVEQGSSLIISASTPQLNLSVKTGATAKISGIVTFTGTSSNYLNAADSLSIMFKQGSVLNQNCPGNIFSAAGIKNAVVFEDGSSLVINNVNAASPFGLSVPNSKVVFQHGSNLKLSVNAANALSLNGRTYSNILLQNNANLSVNEFFNTPMYVDEITVNTNCYLRIKNTNWNTNTNINIKGDLNINGYFGFSDSSNHRNITLNLNGDQSQSVSGTGNIEFGNNLMIVNVYNVLELHRDLVAFCPVRLIGEVHLNGYVLRGNYGNKSATYGTKNETYTNENDNIQNGNNVTNGTNNINEQPTSYSISQNYPNPFNPSTKIDYTLPVSGKVSIKIFDINGRESAVLVDKNQDAGSYTVQFDASKLSSGVYFYTISSEGNGSHFTKTMKMILVK